MRNRLNALPFVAYHVETLMDGRKICITKPGGKQFFGAIQPNDFMVWIYDEDREDRWRISHREILEDIEKKFAASIHLASAFVDTLLRVCEGEEPTVIIEKHELDSFSALPGISAEAILRSYKWIWVQEDCNYPTGEGRWKSMNGILGLRKRLQQIAPTS